MSQTIKLKRSAIAGKVPTTSSLDLGEIALNTNDGKAYLKKNDGSESIQTFVVTDSLTTGSIVLTGQVSASVFSGSFFGNGTGLTRNMAITGSDVFGNQFEDHVSVLHFDSDTGINVSASAPNTAFIKLGSHFRDFFVDGSATIVATGSDQMDIIANGGLDISTSLTDTNGNGVSKELIFAVDATVARTGSNTFTADQTIEGKVTSSTLDTSGNAIIRGDLDILGDINISGEIDGHISVTPVASDSNNSNGVVIQDLTFDGFGHTRTLGTVNLDDRYYTETEADSRFVNVTGDTITGSLIVSASGATNDFQVGDDKLFVSASGNVGIGTTSPSERLDVAGSMTISGDIDLTAGQLELRGDVALDHDGNALYVKAPSSIFFYPGNSNKANINSSGNFTLAGNLDINGTGTSTIAGDLTVDGKVTAQEFHTEFVSASIIYQSGSTKFGDTSDDLHSFSGSVSISGSAENLLTLRGMTPTGAGGLKVEDPTAAAYGAHFTYLDGATEVSIGGITNNTRNDVIRLDRDTTQTIKIDNTGVGIGTASPGSALDVAGILTINTRDIASNPRLVFNHDNILGASFIEVDRGTEDMEFWVSGSERMRIMDNGNVGIGTTSPPHKFSVFGTGAGNATVQIEGEGGADPFINFLANNTQHWALGIDDSDGDKFKLSEHSALGTNDYLVVDTSGNVGIGTTSIDNKLHVQGGGMKLEESSGNIDFRLTLNGDNKYNIGYQASGDAWGVYHNPGSAYRIYVTGSNGNVGIGTDSPANKLDVAGTVRIQNTGAATLILDGDTNNSGDSGDTDSIIDMRHDAGTFGMRLSTRNFSGKSAFRIQENRNGIYSERFYINEDGNVGIGTASPASVSKLHVVNDNGQNGTVKLGGSEDALGLVINYDQSSATTTSITSNPSYTNTSALMILRVDGDSSSTANQLVLKGDGNVGIGTTNPTSKLQVAGTLDVNTASSGLPTIKLTHTNSSADNFEIKAGITGVTNSGFSIRDTDASANRFVIDSSGNVGIGTTSPTLAKLQISSGASAGIRVESSSGQNALEIGGTGNVSIDYPNIVGGRFTIDGEGNVNIPRGDLTVGGIVTAQEFHTEFVSASIIYQSGSTKFGDTSDDVHSFSGSLRVTGSGDHYFTDGNVGIGTTSLSQKITIGFPDNGTNGLAFRSATYANLAKILVQNESSSQNGNIQFHTRNGGASAERMRIDTSGNVLVGHTSAEGDSSGTTLYQNGQTVHKADGAYALELVRSTSDGDIVRFRKDGTTVGNIGTFGTDLFIGTNDSGLRFEYAGTNAIVPFDVNSIAVSDNATDLGSSNARFKDLHLGGTATVTALVETSTRELKENIETLEDQSTIVDSLQPVSYTWKEDGKEDFGLIAEDVEEIAPHLVHRNEDGKPTGIKYSKLSVLLLDVVQKQNTLINDLNERITKLENERGE
jgi:cytoskeletal protein CcmA (bactofilin family)